MVLLAFLLSWQSAYTAESVQWEELYTKHGVTVFAGHRASSDLPIFRGRGELAVNLYHLLAIIDDLPRHREWVYRVDRSEVVERPDAFNLVAYLRFAFPWPAADRDGVVRIRVKRHWLPHHEIWIHAEKTTHPLRPPEPGVLRVPRSGGFTRLRWLSPTRTEIEYQLDTDPGGWLPRWLVRWLSEDLPHKIIQGLQAQVQRTQGQYKQFRDTWDPRFNWQIGAPQGFPLPGASPAPMEHDVPSSHAPDVAPKERAH